MPELPCGKKRKNSPARDEIYGVRHLLAIIAPLLVVAAASAQRTVSFPTDDGGLVYADVYGEDDRQSCWPTAASSTRRAGRNRPDMLVAARFRALALDFCGYGKSKGPGDSDPMDAPLYKDVLAAVRYLRKTGAKSVSVVGASMGGWAAGDASIASRPGEIDRRGISRLGAQRPRQQAQVSLPVIVAHDDSSGDGPRLPGIRAQYEKAPEPKDLIILEGSAHAQFLFQTDQADRVISEILRFLSAK